MKITAAVSGLHIRMDVKTKCEIVKEVMTSGLKTKAELNTYIKTLASSIGVNPVTIKIWISKYSSTYQHGLNLPDGVMSYTFLTIPQNKLTKTRQDLTVVRNTIAAIRTKVEVSSIPIAASTIRNTRTATSVLDELIK